MVDFTVFDRSAISELGLSSWLEVREIAQAKPHVLITKFGHLVDWSNAGTEVFPALQRRCEDMFRGDKFWGPFSMRVWAENRSLVGNAVSLESFHQIRPAVHPHAAGDIENQADQHATITVCAPPKTLAGVHAKWSEILDALPDRRRSRVLRSRSHPAIQLHAFHDEFTLGDHIDVHLEALNAIRYVKDARLILGRSCTFVAGVPMKKRTEEVDQLHGPFDPD